jgi:hypothetical protein
MLALQNAWREASSDPAGGLKTTGEMSPMGGKMDLISCLMCLHTLRGIFHTDKFGIGSIKIKEKSRGK